MAATPVFTLSAIATTVTLGQYVSTVLRMSALDNGSSSIMITRIMKKFSTNVRIKSIQ
jgi:hypothetical protein